MGLNQLLLKELHHSPFLVKLAASLHILLQQQQQQPISVDMLRSHHVPSSGDSLQDSCVRLILCLTVQQGLLFEQQRFQHVLDLAALLSGSPESGLPLRLLLSKPGEDNSASTEIPSRDLLGNTEALTAAAQVLTLSGLALWSSDGAQLLMPPLVQVSWKSIFHSGFHRSEAAVFGSAFWRVLELTLSHGASSDPFQWAHCKPLLALGVHLCESEVLKQALLAPESCDDAVRFVSVVARCVRGFPSIHPRIQQILRDSINCMRHHPDANASLVNVLCLCLADILSEQREDVTALKEAVDIYSDIHTKTAKIGAASISPREMSTAALSLGTFADLLPASDCSDEAVEMYRQRALELYLENSTNNPVMVPLVAKIAWLLERKGPRYYQSAEEFYLKAYTLCKSFNNPANPDYYSAHVASLLCSLASLLIRNDQARRRSEDAEEFCREALQINLFLFRAQGRNQALVSSHSNLTATLYLLLESVGDDFGLKTENLYRCSLELCESLHSSSLGMHRSVILALTSLATLFERRNQLADAKSLYHRAAGVSEILHAGVLSQESHSDCSRALSNMASVLEKQGHTRLPPALTSSPISSSPAATFP